MRRLLVQVCVRLSFAPVCVYVCAWLNLHECCCCRSLYLYVCVFDVSESNFLPAGLKCRQARIVLFWIMYILYDTWTQLVGVCGGWGGCHPTRYSMAIVSFSLALSFAHALSVYLSFCMFFIFSSYFSFLLTGASTAVRRCQMSCGWVLFNLKFWRFVC